MKLNDGKGFITESDCKNAITAWKQLNNNTSNRLKCKGVIVQ